MSKRHPDTLLAKILPGTICSVDALQAISVQQARPLFYDSRPVLSPIVLSIRQQDV